MKDSTVTLAKWAAVVVCWVLVCAYIVHGITVLSVRLGMLVDAL